MSNQTSLIISPPVIAHRGASAYAPENSHSAFLKAKQLGVQWVEFDVQITADGELVIFHDEDLSRTSNGKGYLYQYTLAQLKEFDMGSWFDVSFHSEKIVTLAEMIDFLNTQQLSANIEIKARPGTELLVAKKLMAILQDGKVPFFVSSFSFAMLSALRQLHCGFRLSLLLDHWVSNWQSICDELNCVGIGIDYQLLTAERIKAIHATKRIVMAYTVNDSRQAADLFAQGVDAIFSDCPDKMLVAGGNK